MIRGVNELADTMAGSAGVLTIAELYDEVDDVLSRAFPRNRQLWVRGEVHSVADQHGKTGHCYIDLIDPDTAGNRQAPVLRVKCWRATWGPLRELLSREGVTLQPGMVATIRGTLDFYRPRAEVGFILAELDVTALLGRLAAQRAALLEALAAEGLLNRNPALPVPPVPLRIGLVASLGTEGYRDFVGQLVGSGFAFDVSVASCPVQGPDAPPAIARALHTLAALGPDRLDLVVLVRGGGSKADLAAFDAEPVARAIATCPLPVWTGIGHTGDESVADLVANRSCITPTECGRELALRVARWWETSVALPASSLARTSTALLTEAEGSCEAARRRLSGTCRHLVHHQTERLGERAAAVGRLANQVTGDAIASLAARSTRIGPLAVAHLDRADASSASWRRLLSAYDVDRQLQRGYTLTSDPDGRLIRSARQIAPGSVLTTRFPDGTSRSIVDLVDLVNPADPATPADPGSPNLTAGQPAEPSRTPGD